MATLVPCRDCGQSISPNAKACPHCGAPVKPKTKKSTAIIALLAVVTIAAIAFQANDPNRPAPTPNNAADDAARACEALKRSGASACRYEVNVTEPNAIEATYAERIADPGELCPQIAGLLRSKSAALHHSPNPWELRLFTHISARPVASCRI